MKINERIKRLRINKGMSQEELAEQMGYTSISTISKIEKGLNIIPLKKLEKLAEILGTTTEYLLKGNSNTMGDRIKSLRLDSGLSQEALGELIGVNVQNIYRYEKGIITDLPISRIEKLAEALNTTTDYLINGNTNIQGVSSIGDRLKAVRKNKGLTLEQLAEIFSNRHNSNIHKSMLSNWENNKVQPTIDSLNMYSSYFNVSVDYILNNTITYTQDMTSIGERLKTLRTEAGLTQDELADILNKKYNRKLSKITISKIENGERNLSQKMSKIYSSYFNVTIDYLLNGTNSILPEPIIENLGIEIVPVNVNIKMKCF